MTLGTPHVLIVGADALLAARFDLRLEAGLYRVRGERDPTVPVSWWWSWRWPFLRRRRGCVVYLERIEP